MGRNAPRRGIAMRADLSLRVSGQRSTVQDGECIEQLDHVQERPYTIFNVYGSACRSLRESRALHGNLSRYSAVHTSVSQFRIINAKPH
jgi:hypothetical protein